MKISKANLGFEIEPLLSPFGFKGGYVKDIWHSAALLEAEGQTGLGLGLQSVLWSDAGVFQATSPGGGNCLMYLISEYALKRLVGRTLEYPLDMAMEIYEDALGYAQRLTGRKDLRPTFALNALVPVDMALWSLYAKANGVSRFDELIPPCAKEALSARHSLVGGIPLITYGLGIEEVRQQAEAGAFLIKIKIGSDPDKDGDQQKMLEWDKARLSQIHDALKYAQTEHTATGRIAYYLDANGRYDSRQRLESLLEHADRIGMLPRVVILEEPFPEGSGIDVRGLPVPVAADESAHSLDDARQLLDAGYRQIALKPIAKTISMSFLILGEAHRRGAPCFCADLTVNPLMVEWNKNFAARMRPIPGVKPGILEVNGHQNYVNWQRMLGYHPMGDAPWATPRDGVYRLNDAFYQTGGGIFLPAPHYEQVARGA